MNYVESTLISRRLYDLMRDAVETNRDDRHTKGPRPKAFGIRLLGGVKPGFSFIPREGITGQPVPVTMGQCISALRQAVHRLSTGAPLNTSTLGAQASGSYLLVLWREVEDQYRELYGAFPWETPFPIHQPGGS